MKILMRYPSHEFSLAEASGTSGTSGTVAPLLGAQLKWQFSHDKSPEFRWGFSIGTYIVIGYFLGTYIGTIGYYRDLYIVNFC